MVATVEERIAWLEARVNLLEERLAQPAEPKTGLTIEEAKEWLNKPVQHGPEEYEQLRRFVGSFEGPEDLSEHMRDYLYGYRDCDDRQ